MKTKLWFGGLEFEAEVENAEVGKEANEHFCNAMNRDQDLWYQTLEEKEFNMSFVINNKVKDVTFVEKTKKERQSW